MKSFYSFLLFLFFILLQGVAYSQQPDSTLKRKDSVIYISGASATEEALSSKAAVRSTKDSTVKKKHDPHKATLYSAFLPGLGQIYNRKYWKLPLVYAAVGIPAYTYFDNKKWYNKAQYALTVLLTGTTDSTASWRDSLSKVDPKLRVLVLGGYDSYIRSFRNEVRKYQDYSILFVLLFWGLNVVDATVDAHLKDFDVSSELSFRIQPVSGPVSGIGLVFDLHKARFRPFDLR